jgi:hypothetical protein
MLLRIGNDRPFPHNDLSYLAFVTNAYCNFHQAETAYDPAQPLSFRDEVEWLLDEIPLLAHLPGSIQIDLLAEVWARHDAKKVHRASLLDAAVLSSVCRVAADTLASDRGIVRLSLAGATRDLDIRLDRWTLRRLQTLFERWGPSCDLRRAHDESDLRDYPPSVRGTLEAARFRPDVSLGMARNLEGLVTPAEIRHFVALLTAPEGQP